MVIFMKKEDLRVKKTRKLLCMALFELLQQKSFEEIRLTELCDKSMVHKTTFYNHFNDKYELLKYALNELQKELIEKINSSSNNNVIDYYCDIAKIYMEHIKTNAKLYSSLISFNKDSISMDIFFNNFKKDLEKRIDNKTIPVNYISSYYVSGVFAVVLEWFKNGMKESENQMIEYIKILIGTR